MMRRSSTVSPGCDHSTAPTDREDPQRPHRVEAGEHEPSRPRVSDEVCRTRRSREASKRPQLERKSSSRKVNGSPLLVRAGEESSVESNAARVPVATRRRRHRRGRGDGGRT